MGHTEDMDMQESKPQKPSNPTPAAAPPPTTPDVEASDCGCCGEEGEEGEEDPAKLVVLKAAYAKLIDLEYHPERKQALMSLLEDLGS